MDDMDDDEFEFNLAIGVFKLMTGAEQRAALRAFAPYFVMHPINVPGSVDRAFSRAVVAVVRHEKQPVQS